MAVEQGFADHATDEFEEVQVVGVYEALRVRIISHAVWSQVEKTVVGVEHRSGKLNEKVTGKASCISASLASKVHM